MLSTLRYSVTAVEHGPFAYFDPSPDLPIRFYSDDMTLTKGVRVEVRGDPPIGTIIAASARMMSFHASVAGLLAIDPIDYGAVQYTVLHQSP